MLKLTLVLLVAGTVLTTLLATAGDTPVHTALAPVQLNSTGPGAVTYGNPNEDPRKAKP